MILRLTVLVICAALAAAPARAASEAPLLVFAAASLTDALSAVGASYEEAGKGKAVFSFAGSMTLARQIEASSGADVFVSADPQSMDYLQMRGLIAEATRSDLLGNTLVLVAPADSQIGLDIAPGFALAPALGGGRLALANTASVPAGRYARAALATLGVWDEVAMRLAEAEDVRAALALVARGETPLGIVYATDARAEPRVRIAGTFSAASHPPIVYPAALTRDARAGARGFLDYLRSADARAAFERAGFTVLD